MYRTIQLSSCVLVQGEFVEVLADGQIVVRDGMTMYRGQPIAKRPIQFMPDVLAQTAELGLRAS